MKKIELKLFFDKDGKEIDVLLWSKLFENFSYRLISSTYLKSGYRVLTVWLGVNHGMCNCPKFIFETMVFKGKSLRGLNRDQYDILKAAIAGHKSMVQKWKLKHEPTTTKARAPRKLAKRKAKVKG